ncbi:hypothetical protein, partial [Curtobacterium pusillum]|uniref:hypothetical protein n=1 Tax=Curtobacterium pusillum TaxID=69373 RepID=UPI0011A38EFC
MSHKNRARALKSIGAAGLAAATVVSGLSFGAAASAATAASPAPQAVTQANSSRVVGPWVSRSSSDVYTAVTTPSQGAQLLGYHGNSLSAVASRATVWSFPAAGATGPVRFDGSDLCLTYSGERYDVKTATCDGSPGQQFVTSPVNHRFAAGYGVRAIEPKNGKYAWISESTNGNPANFQFVEGSADGRDPWIDTIVGVENFDPAFSASVEAGSVDVAARTAKLVGSSEPNADVIINDTIPVKANAEGAWSKELTGLKLGKQSVKVEQFLNNERVGDPIQVEVDLAVAPLTASAVFSSDPSVPVL